MRIHLGKFLLAVLLISIQGGRAGSHTWSGAVDGLWSNPSNWSSGGAPLNGEAGLQLFFPTGATRLNTTNNIGNLSVELMMIQGSGYTHHGLNSGTNLLVANAGTIYSSGLANTLGSTLNLNFVGYGSFQVAFDSALTVQGKIHGLGNPLHKLGEGVLTFSSTVDNTYAGTTYVNEGTLRLENGLPFFSGWISSVAIPGPLVIGTTNLAESAKVIFLQADQLSTNGTVTINANGSLDLNNHDGTVGPLTLAGGSVASGTGTLTLNGNVTVNSSPLTNGTVSGKVSLGDQSRTIHVGGGQMTISANIRDDIDGRGTAGITKTGAGKLVLSGGTNTFTGSVNVNGGALRITTNRSLGTTNAGTFVASGAQLELSNVMVTDEPLTVSGTGTNASSGAILIAGDSSWIGPVTLPADASISTPNPTDLAFLMGPISGAGGLKKKGPGTLTLSGAAPNTYAGTTTVSGKLRLFKPAGVCSVAGPLVIGDSVAAGTNDQVLVFSYAQIHENAPVTIHPSGLLQLGTTDQALANIIMAGGRIEGSTGSLSMIGKITALNTPWGGGMITCKIALGGVTRNFDVPFGGDLFVTGVISDQGLGAGIHKTGDGLLVFVSNNTYGGPTTISAGELSIYSSTSLGNIAEGTVVEDGACLTMNNVGDCMETITLNGDGPGIFDNALNAVQTNLLSGNLICATDTTIRTPAATDKLVIAGVVTGPATMTKRGSGTVEFSGATDNSLQGVLVHAGQLKLRKSAGAAAITGGLTVGNDLDPVNSAAVILEAHNQIENTAPIQIHKSGRLSFGAFVDTVGALSFTGGKVETTSGVLTLNGNVTVTNAVQFATIDGKLSLGSVSRTFAIDGGLGINAVVSATAGTAGIHKTGTGNLSLHAANTYAGPTTVDAGTLQLAGNGRPGTVDSGTTIAAGATLYLYLAGTVTGETLTLEGTGPDFGGALRVYGDNTWMGPMTLSGDTTVMVLNSGDELTINSAIDGTGSLTKQGSGNLRFSGTSPNTYNGVTRVDLGKLKLSKSAGIAAVPGTLHVGEDIEDVFKAHVEVLADSQIADNATIYMHQSGYLKLSSGNESVGPLSISGGRVESFGNTLTLLGGVSADPSPYGPGSIAGTLSLNGGNRTFNIASNAQLNLESSLINGALSAAGVQKTGAGALELQSSNAFTGPMVVAAGTVMVRNPHAFGGAGGGVIVSNGAQLSLDFNIHIGQEPLTIAGMGNGFAAFTIYGTNSWGGPITLLDNVGFGVIGTNSRLHLPNALSGIGGLTKQGQGTLHFEGTNANTFFGTTHVLQGALALNKTNATAIAGPLQVGSTVKLMRPQQIADLSAVTVLPFGLLDLSNYEETIGSLSGGGNVSLGSAMLTVGDNHTSTTFSGILSGNANPMQANLMKTGAGVLTLNGNNSYTGETLVFGGKLLVNGAQNGTVQIFNGATLGGSGSVGTVMALTGFVSPGNNGPGALQCSNLIYGFGGGLVVELNGTNAITEYDQVKITGDANLNGSLNVTLNFTSAASNSFVILNRAGTNQVSGEFTDLPEGAIFSVNGRQFKISYAGGDGNDVVLNQLTQPLPANISRILRYLDGHIELDGTGTPGLPYILQANTDLNTTNWINIGTFNANPQGHVYGMDPNATNFTQRFYRFMVP